MYNRINQTLSIVFSMLMCFPLVSCGDDDSEDSSSSKGNGTLNGHDYVDLGLPSGTKWATCNVGASNPEGYGDYFAWGETKPKDEYYASDYSWYNDRGFIKYTNSVLLPKDDAATVNWGTDWRMPTVDEMNELISKCKFSWTEINGVEGGKFTAKNGNFIFLPAAGHKYGSHFSLEGESGGYWTSSNADANYIPVPSYILFDSENKPYYLLEDHSHRGYSVRPVCK